MCAIKDCSSNKIVGYSIDSHMLASLVACAIRNAIMIRMPDGTILHSDRGSQGGFNWSSQHSAIMEVCDGSSSTVSRSCGSPGNEVPWFKTEAVGKNNPFHPGPFKSIADIEYATMGWVDWYNNRRLRSTLNNIPPAEFELNYYATHFASQPVISRT